MWPIVVFEEKNLDAEPVPGDQEVPGGAVLTVLGHIQVNKLPQTRHYINLQSNNLIFTKLHNL